MGTAQLMVTAVMVEGRSKGRTDRRGTEEDQRELFCSQYS